MLSFLLMRRFVLALLLLATFVLGLTAGAHPCQAAHGEAKEEPAPPSCHEAMGQPQAAPADPSLKAGTPSGGERNCCEIACRHACHLVAVVSFQPVTFPAALVAQRLVLTAEHGSSPFAGGIDHIPLP